MRDRDLEGSITHAHRVKVDPGSKTTGLVLLREGDNKLLWAGELSHRGQVIKYSLDDRRALRHSRRNRKCRYRPPRFDNRKRQAGWLPPSLESRVANIKTWVIRLARSAPVEAISMELVKFDTQALQNPEISGVEYSRENC
jgi:hypothetical protein